MFTGIIKEIGKVGRFEDTGGVRRLEVVSKTVAGDSAIGGSVAVNGVCLTVVEKVHGMISFDIMQETLKKTGLGGLKTGDAVNLEHSMRPDGGVDGHFVLGHVDCVGTIGSVGNSRDGSFIKVSYPPEFSSLLVDKGSVALDGVSLTVTSPFRDSFVVYLIPHTMKITTLGMKRPGDRINIEFDIIGKYIARRKEDRLTEGFLKEHGFRLG